MATETLDRPVGCAGYQLVDSHTGKLLRVYGGNDAGRRAAQRRADALDMQYGAVRYVVRPMWVRS